MVMRYYWGLAVGHVYSHSQHPASNVHTLGQGLHQHEKDITTNRQSHELAIPAQGSTAPIDLNHLLTMLHTLDDMDMEIDQYEVGIEDDNDVGFVDDVNDEDWQGNSDDEDEDDLRD
ncbi:hypothetical protein DXG01_015058, partial [Tephrocybe rancida]